mmetsp:Transcript_108456/g.306688  ORF Transcript_108456/g.306688 Transcript_108456/m.306688 type:complete len:406 (+) Transcript_108456:2-1219(+)
MAETPMQRLKEGVSHSPGSCGGAASSAAAPALRRHAPGAPLPRPPHIIFSVAAVAALRTDSTASDLIMSTASCRATASFPNAPIVRSAATRTSTSGSARLSAMSSRSAAPRPPIRASDSSAATRTFASESPRQFPTFTAYMWPFTPSFATAPTTAALTRPQRSPKHFTSLPMQGNTLSPIVPSAVAALARMHGCWLLSIFTTPSTASGLEPPVACPMDPTARMAPEAARRSLSANSAITWASYLAPPAPILPRASAAYSRTSPFPSARSFATFSADLAPSLPSFDSASAAAHLAILSEAGCLPMMHAADSMADCLSSKPSSSSFAIAPAWSLAFCPMPPSTTAAAHFAPPPPDARSFATSLAVTAFPASAEHAATAAARTPASASPRHWQISAPSLEAAPSTVAK